MQQYLIYLTNLPSIVIIAFIVFLIKYYDKLSLIFPNNRRKLDGLINSQTTGTKDDADFDKFLSKEIEKANFLCATGLTKNLRNQKLLPLYDDISDELEWDKFRRIERYIKNLDKLEKVPSLTIGLRYYFWLGAFSILIIGFFYSVWKIGKNEVNIQFVNDYLILLFQFILFGIIFSYPWTNVQILKKYNQIVEDKMEKEEVLDLQEIL